MDEVASGVVVPDPAKGAPKDTALTFQATQFHPVAEQAAGALDRWEHFGSALLSISFMAGDDLRADGSAVMIGPGLALAARHVFEPRLDAIMSSVEVPMLHAITEHGLQLWVLKQIVFGNTDVVILRIDLASEFPPNNQFEIATLTTRVPKKGERVQIAGFRSEGTEDGKILGQVRVGIGEVTEVYLTGRDSVMLPFPCVEVRCLTLGGMSGGPAFDERGMLLGVLTSSFEHDEGPSYVALAFPVFGSKIETFWLSGAVTLPASIVALAERGLVALEGADSFEINADGSAKLRLRD